MDYLDSIILGIIQGLSEFLPVSSSGHLEIGKIILGEKLAPKESMIFTTVLHFATALSTMIVFRYEIFKICSDFIKIELNSNTYFVFKIIISMIPAVIIGVYFENILESLFSNNILLVGTMLILTAFLLILADIKTNSIKTIKTKSAFLIGIAQAIAILPGISRSGATISTAVLLGIEKTKAAKFSFLMVIPLIFGKIIKDIFSGQLIYESHQFPILITGFTAAFLSGLFACTCMMHIVKNSKLKYFAIYCGLVGLFSVIYSLTK